MLSFAKTTEFQDDLYSGLVAPKLMSNLLTETWNNGKIFISKNEAIWFEKVELYFVNHFFLIKKGAGTLPSNCSAKIAFHVNNIEEIKIDPLVPGFKFSVHHDHSKWAVTKSNDDLDDLFIDDSNNSTNNSNSSSVERRRRSGQAVRIACIGDINRQEEQFKRGGGTVCFMSNENVWRAYSQLVNEVQQCSKTRTLRWKKIKYTISGEALVLM